MKQCDVLTSFGDCVVVSIGRGVVVVVVDVVCLIIAVKLICSFIEGAALAAGAGIVFSGDSEVELASVSKA